MVAWPEFREWAEARRPDDVGPEAWAYALETLPTVTGRKTFGPSDLELVSAMARGPWDTPAAPEPESWGLETTPVTRLDTERLVQAVLPAVLHVRRHLFSGQGPPFPDDEAAAVEWIRVEAPGAEEVTAQWQEKQDRVHELTKEIQQLAPLGLEPFAVSMSVRLLYVDPEASKAIDVYARTGPLLYLAVAARKLSEASGFYEHALTRYILTGIEPSPPRVKIRGRSLSGFVKLEDSAFFALIRRAEVHVTLLASDLRDAEIREIARVARKQFGGGARTRPRVTDEDLLLDRIALAAGWRDEDGVRWSGALWKGIAQQWGEATGTPEVHARTLISRYRRFLAKRDEASSVRTSISPAGRRALAELREPVA